jgi:hypothetical protein
MSHDPYVQAQELHEGLERATGPLGVVLDRPEALAQRGDHR